MLKLIAWLVSCTTPKIHELYCKSTKRKQVTNAPKSWLQFSEEIQ